MQEMNPADEPPAVCHRIPLMVVCRPGEVIMRKQQMNGLAAGPPVV